MTICLRRGGGGNNGGGHPAAAAVAAVAPPPPAPQQSAVVAPIPPAADGGGPEARQDAFLSAAKACVRADGPRCGRLEAGKMLSLCNRFGLRVPPDMAEAARRKGLCSYTIFIDRLREVAPIS